MTHTHSVTIAATVGGLATSLLLVACGTSTPPTPADTRTQATNHGAAGSPTAAQSSATTTSAAAVRASSPPTSVTAAAACSLITEQDVTTAVGTDPGAGAANSHDGATACAYGSYPKQVLTVNVVPAHGRAGYAQFRQDPHLVNGTGLRIANVPGLGDQAFELSGPHTDAIYFTKGDALVVIGSSAPTSPTKGAALSLARIAARRLR